MTVIGLTGFARAGKDTVGKILVDHYGFRRVAFGDVLKGIAEDMDPILDIEDAGSRYHARTSEVLACTGSWENAKDQVPESRDWLVRLGNSLRKRIHGIEVMAALQDVSPGEDVVLTNVYHPEEIKQIQNLGGIVIRVIRPGCGPANGDEANTARCPVDATVFNDGGLDKLQVNTDLVLRYLNFRPRHMQGVAG